MKMERIILIISVILIIALNPEAEACYKLHENRQGDFLHRWKDLQKVIYNGNSIQELLDLCPNGCPSPDCLFVDPFEAARHREPGAPPTVPTKPCSEDDMIALRKAQEIWRGWLELKDHAKNNLIIHGTLVGIIFLLIVVLVLRGHYRVRDLWFLPPDRQWELERNPTLGLPGKVWSLLKIRVVKSSKNEPTDRKYFSYTENPTVMGNKFWYYKHAIRETYKKHKYYKRNRYFHKLAYQVNKLGVVIPELLRPVAKKEKLPGQLLEAPKKVQVQDEYEVDNQVPWELDLADEVNRIYLQKAKQIVKEQVDKKTAEGTFVNGRFQPPLTHHHHHHTHSHHARTHAQKLQDPLTKEEIRKVARKLEGDQHAEYVTVDGVTRMISGKKLSKAGMLFGHHHHRHHNGEQGESESTKDKKRKSERQNSKSGDTREQGTKW